MIAHPSSNPAAAFYASPAARALGAAVRAAHGLSAGIGTALAMRLFFTPVARDRRARVSAVPAPWRRERHRFRRRPSRELAAQRQGRRPPRPADARMGRRRPADACAGRRIGSSRPRPRLARFARPWRQRRHARHVAAVGASAVRGVGHPRPLAWRGRAFAGRAGGRARVGAGAVGERGWRWWPRRHRRHCSCAGMPPGLA